MFSTSHIWPTRFHFPLFLHKSESRRVFKSFVVIVQPSTECCLSIHFSTFYRRLSCTRGRWILDESPVYRWANTKRDKQPSTLALTDHLELPVNPACMSLVCGRKPEYPDYGNSPFISVAFEAQREWIAWLKPPDTLFQFYICGFVPLTGFIK